MCHNNKDGRVQRILGNSYGQPIISDMWNSSAPYRFCNRDHKHPEYGRVLTGDSNGKMYTCIFSSLFYSLFFRGDLACHNNKDGRVQRILGNSYGQPIISDMWNSSAPYRFCNRDHKHPEYGRVLTGDSNGIVILRREHFTI